MKKLATIRSISSFEDMQGYDNVYLAHVDGWQSIVRKEDFHTVGEKVIFIEPGAQLPEKEEYLFLKPRKFRVKTIKMRGNLSQGLILPYKGDEEIGTDVTEKLGITDFTDQDIQQEIRRPKGIVAWLMRYRLTRWLGRLFLPKKVSLNFPAWITKTDEERIQNCPNVLNIEAKDWFGTEKIDGSSGTFAVRRYKTWWGGYRYEEFVCSRNLRCHPKYDTNLCWMKLNEKYHITEQMVNWLKRRPEEEYIIIQGECIGPKIQGNPYKVSDLDFYVFNLITSKQGKVNPVVGETITWVDMACAMEKWTDDASHRYCLKWAPIIFHCKGKLSDEIRFNNIVSALEFSNGKSRLNEETIREGIVVRSYDKHISFKVVSPDYLIKKGE